MNYLRMLIMVGVFALPSLAWAQDAGVVDAGLADAPLSDAGLTDAGVVADAGAEAAVMPEGAELVPAIISAAKGKEWSLLVSFVIMLLVWAGTKAPFLKKYIKGKAKIWVAAIAGVLAAFATALFVDINDGDGVINWLKVIMDGLSVGLAAGGLWSLIGRKIMGEPIDADGDGKLDDVNQD